MIKGVDTDTEETAAGRIDNEQLLRVEICKVLCDFRDGAGDGHEEAVERILEITGRADA